MTAPAKKLTVGRGMNMRVTKAGKAAEAHFDALVIEHLKSIGATPPPEGVYPRWIVETIHGRLGVTPLGHWIAQSFMDWPKDYKACIAHARERGFDHWKWNFHFDIGAAEAEVDYWKRQLARVLPPQEAVHKPEPKDHSGRLHKMAARWLAERASPEEQGGLGVFADTRFCADLTKLLEQVDRAARREERRAAKERT